MDVATALTRSARSEAPAGSCDQREERAWGDELAECVYVRATVMPDTGYAALAPHPVDSASLVHRTAQAL